MITQPSLPCAAHHTNLLANTQATAVLYSALKPEVVRLRIYPVGILGCMKSDPCDERSNVKKIANNASNDFKNIQCSDGLPAFLGEYVFVRECWLAALLQTGVGRRV